MSLPQFPELTKVSGRTGMKRRTNGGGEFFLGKESLAISRRKASEKQIILVEKPNFESGIQTRPQQGLRALSV